MQWWIPSMSGVQAKKLHHQIIWEIHLSYSLRRRKNARLSPVASTWVGRDWTRGKVHTISRLRDTQIRASTVVFNRMYLGGHSADKSHLVTTNKCLTPLEDSKLALLFNRLLKLVEMPIQPRIFWLQMLVDTFLRSSRNHRDIQRLDINSETCTC